MRGRAVIQQLRCADTDAVAPVVQPVGEPAQVDGHETPAAYCVHYPVRCASDGCTEELLATILVQDQSKAWMAAPQALGWAATLGWKVVGWAPRNPSAFCTEHAAPLIVDDDEANADGFEVALDTFLEKHPYAKGDQRLLLAIDFLTAWQAGCAERDPSVKTEALAEAAGHIRHLFRSRPMNGDGSNNALRQALDILIRLGGQPVDAAVRAAEHEIGEREAAQYERRDRINAERRRLASSPRCPECRAGKCVNCTGETLVGDDMVACACKEAGHPTHD